MCILSTWWYTPEPSQHATSLRNFITQQNETGWYNILLGCIPTSLYESLTFKTKCKRPTWISNIIKTIYAYANTIWVARNTLIHSAPNTTTPDHHLISMQHTVRSWYTRRSELTPAGRALLPSNQDSINNLSKYALAKLINLLIYKISQISIAPNYRQKRERT